MFMEVINMEKDQIIEAVIGGTLTMILLSMYNKHKQQKEIKRGLNEVKNQYKQRYCFRKEEA